MSANKRTESLWERITSIFSRSIGLSLCAALILILIGMITGGIVNAISASELLTQTYVSWGMGGIAVVFCGFFIFFPFWKFRWKYQFLDEQEEVLASKLVAINKRAQNIVRSIDGIMAFQMFKVEKHTDDHHILYQFKPVITQKAKGADISGLRYNKINVPIHLINYCETLTPSQPPKNYGQFLNSMLFEFLCKQVSHNIAIKDVISKWDVYLEQNARIIGIHYVTIFDMTRVLSVESSEDYLYLSDLESFIEDDSIYGMRYNGSKEKHANRAYYTLRISIDGADEGVQEYVALVIANNRIINIANRHLVGRVMAKILFNPEHFAAALTSDKVHRFPARKNSGGSL